MRIEIDKLTGLRTEYPDKGKWLYQEQTPEYRYFTSSVLLGKNAEPWPECTNEQKKAWEDAHYPNEEQQET